MATLKNTSINNTESVVFPIGTTASRPSPLTAMSRYNSSYSRPEFYTNSTWQTLGFPYLYYNEGIKANLFTANWNDATTTTMANFGSLGYVTAHGWNTGPATYTLTLTGLPTHTTIRYCVYWHLVDSLDNETNQLFVKNNSDTETEILRFTKVYNTVPSFSIIGTGVSAKWYGGLFYTYRPWGNGVYGQDGYIVVDSGYYSHTLSTFTARHVLGADQPALDEAEYLSHVQVWLGT
jgi:hypothetical protein